MEDVTPERKPVKVTLKVMLEKQEHEDKVRTAVHRRKTWLRLRLQ